jgi:hypothetical protein
MRKEYIEMKEKTMLDEIKPVKDQQKNQKITLLQNSFYYFIECVFIIIGENNFRLIALHKQRVLLDKKYKTLRGSKIAFTKFFQDKAWKSNVKPVWTPGYLPNKDWLEQKINMT